MTDPCPNHSFLVRANIGCAACLMEDLLRIRSELEFLKATLAKLLASPQ